MSMYNHVHYSSIIIIASYFLANLVQRFEILTITTILLFIIQLKVNNSFLLFDIEEKFFFLNDIIEKNTSIIIDSNNLLLFFIIICLITIIKKKNYTLKNNIYINKSYVFSIFFSSFYNTDYKPIINNNYILYDNMLVVLHPLLIMFLLVYLYNGILSKIIELFYEHKKNIHIHNKYKYILIYLIMSLYLGSVWAITTDGWGGAWVWDPIEILLVIILIISIIYVHRIFYKNFVLNINMYIILIIYIWAHFTLRNMNFLNGIHKFFSEKIIIENKIDYSIINNIFYILIIYYLYKRNKLTESNNTTNMHYIVVLVLSTNITILIISNTNIIDLINNKITYSYLIIIILLFFYIKKKKNYIKNYLYLLTVSFIKSYVIQILTSTIIWYFKKTYSFVKEKLNYKHFFFFIYIYTIFISYYSFSYLYVPIYNTYILDIGNTSKPDFILFEQMKYYFNNISNKLNINNDTTKYYEENISLNKISTKKKNIINTLTNFIDFIYYMPKKKRYFFTIFYENKVTKNINIYINFFSIKTLLFVFWIIQSQKKNIQYDR